MRSESRIKNSIRNSVSGIITQAIGTLLGFIVRTFFIHYLSAEYLGVNGLFSNILTLLSLAELGVGGAIVYSMYKPLAVHDDLQVAKLMNFYRTAYRIIGISVAILGLSLLPFLDIIVKEKDGIEHLGIIYLLFLSNTVVSYFCAYKRTVFSADQRESVLSYYDFAFNCIRYCLQIAVLIILHSFIAFVVIQILCTLACNIAISIYADKQYPFLKLNKNQHLSKEDRSSIFKNIKALFIYKVGSTALDGTDNVIISALNGVVNVGLLSNYSLLTGSVQTFLNKIVGALTGSVGNFIATENNDRYEDMLNKISFFYFILYGLFFVVGIAILTPFVKIWAGIEYILDDRIVFVHCLNIYIFGMMSSIWTFRSSMGLFVYGKYRPLVSAFINLFVSIWWGKLFGMIGVLLGTTVTRLLTNVIYDPYIVYKYGIRSSVINYYKRWLIYIIAVLLDVFLVYAIRFFLDVAPIIELIIFPIFAIFIFVVTVTVFFGRTDEYKYTRKMTLSILNHPFPEGRGDVKVNNCEPNTLN